MNAETEYSAAYVKKDVLKSGTHAHNPYNLLDDISSKKLHYKNKVI